ncbi:MAG: YdbL family protein [Candidatus Tectimicrobiota bacterium]
MQHIFASHRKALLLLVCLVSLLGLVRPSWGVTLEEAKGQGLVGEQPNGYLGLVQPGATPEVQALVKDINQKRRQTYEDIAQRNATTLQAVEMLAGKTAIEQTKPGHFIQMSGRWLKK